jgi:hypothetical protein
MGVAALDALRNHVRCADHPRDTAERRMYGATILANAHQCSERSAIGLFQFPTYSAANKVAPDQFNRVHARPRFCQ